MLTFFLIGCVDNFVSVYDWQSKGTLQISLVKVSKFIDPWGVKKHRNTHEKRLVKDKKITSETLEFHFVTVLKY